MILIGELSICARLAMALHCAEGYFAARQVDHSETNRYGVNQPPTDRFKASLFVDRHGWGNQLSRATVDEWRSERF